MVKPSFREFAHAIAQEDDPGAAAHLVHLLGLVPTAAAGAVIHFRRALEAGGAEFMKKATGLRKAVTSGSAEEVAELLESCFGLTGEQLFAAQGTLRHLFVEHALN